MIHTHTGIGLFGNVFSTTQFRMKPWPTHPLPKLTRFFGIYLTSLYILDAFEMWVYRRVFKKDYQRGVTEKDGNRQRNTPVVRKFKTRKLQYLGHLIRHNTSQIQLIEGKIEGRRSRGRPRNTWTTDITNTNGMKYYQLKRAAEDRRRWHGLVVNLAQETTFRWGIFWHILFKFFIMLFNVCYGHVWKLK